MVIDDGKIGNKGQRLNNCTCWDIGMGRPILAVALASILQTKVIANDIG